MAYDNRDSIDFGAVEIRHLFRTIFVPTLLGMVFDMIFVLTDGIFVGHGVGPDGLASVNLVSPIMMLITGIGMMFGVGGSVVAAIHLAKDNLKAARINCSQALAGSLCVGVLIAVVLYGLPSPVLRLLGTSEALLDMAREYMFWFVPTCIFIMLQIVGAFIIRLDGSPRYAMYCAIVPSVLNIILDYLFIFPFHWGLMGAAFATDIGTGIGAAMTVWYFMGRAQKIHYYPIKMSSVSLHLFARNAGYMMRVGFSAFIGEAAMSVMALCGNLAFGRYLGDMGIAAFCVVCYLYPVVFNVFYAVSTSAQPIISFNHGAHKEQRVEDTFRYSLTIAVGFAATVALLMWFFAPQVISVFLQPGTESFGYAAAGLPLFALGFVLSGFNVTTIGYFQSTEQNLSSTILMTLRGIAMPIVFFVVLPLVWGDRGLWLAVPASELVTIILSVTLLLKGKITRNAGNPQNH